MFVYYIYEQEKFSNKRPFCNGSCYLSARVLTLSAGRMTVKNLLSLPCFSEDTFGIGEEIMNTEEAICFLKQLKTVSARIEAKGFEINRIVKSRDFLETLKMDEIAKANRENGELEAALSTLRVVSDRYGGIIRSLTESMERAASERERAERIFAVLPPVYEKLLRLRYLSQKSWVAVSMELNYSERQTYYLHKSAVAKFAELWSMEE